MGNKPAKQREVLTRIPAPIDPAFVKWLRRDLEEIYGFAPKNPRAIKPPDHYIEFMKLQGWLDLDPDDPDLLRLLKK